MVFPTSVVCVTHTAWKCYKGGENYKLTFLIYLLIAKELWKQLHSEENFLHAYGWSVQKKKRQCYSNK